jgi:hypothetical protein
VYIHEAHAIDGAFPMTGAGRPLVEEPSTLDERKALAKTCLAKLSLAPIPAVVDGMDDAVNRAYDAWPDRLVLVDRKGLVAYRGGPGPGGFKPDELDEAIARELGKPKAK